MKTKTETVSVSMSRQDLLAAENGWFDMWMSYSKKAREYRNMDSDSVRAHVVQVLSNEACDRMKEFSAMKKKLEGGAK